jgi:ribosome-associated translation inhibitor RaiA
MTESLKARARRERRAPMGAAADREPRPTRGRTTSTTTPVHVRNTTARAEIDSEWLRQRLGFKLGKFALQIDRMNVSLRDENGTPGTPTLRATVTLHLARGESIASSARSTTPTAAVSAAIRASERALRRATERRRSARRTTPPPARAPADR